MAGRHAADHPPKKFHNAEWRNFLGFPLTPPATKALTWRRPKAENQKAREQGLYEQLPFCDVADVFRFVNGQCQFLSALTPLQPRYAKKVADADSLMAVIIAQAMNHGNQVMARTSDIPYHVLESTYQQYLGSIEKTGNKAR
ncbi:Tn3 family transposase [Pseudomonas aeruginosa]|nr:Tn3 family transposase [Pseudomonas aeruginosa]